MFAKSKPKGYSEFLDTDKKLKVILYNTKIIEYCPENKVIILNDGNWKTKHTKKCMNLFLNRFNFNLYQKNFTWSVENTITGEEIEYNTGLVIKLQ